MSLTVDEFSYNIQKLCSTCYKEKRIVDFTGSTCNTCHGRIVNPVYVNAKDKSEFVRDFNNSGNTDRGRSIKDCDHKDVLDKFSHATVNKGCSFAMNMFESSVWNWMKTHRKYKISEIFNKYVAPFVYTHIQIIPKNNISTTICHKEYYSAINPVPYSHEANERFQKEEKKKVYFCWFCLHYVTSENEVMRHVNGKDHNSFYEADKKRRWYFKMPKTNTITICLENDCNCFAPHMDEECQEMKARIKFRKFKYKNFDFKEKIINPWPLDVIVTMPLFPRNIECYNESVRITVELVLNGRRLKYVCLREDESRPYFSLHNNYNENEKGQLLKWDYDSDIYAEKIDFDIEFSPLCSGTYIQRLEFAFYLNDNEYCCQKCIRVDIGSRKHLDEFKNIFEKYQSILQRDVEFDYIVPFSTAGDSEDSILSQELLKRVFRVVPNLQWFDTHVEPWNYCDWMRDMMVHEELEQQLLISQLIFMGDIEIKDSFFKVFFIHAKAGQLFGTIEFNNQCHNVFTREFLANNIVKAFILSNDQTFLYECDIVNKYKYLSESRSIKHVTICLSESAVQDLRLKSGDIYRNIVIYFRFNRFVFERRHKSLDNMPHYDSLAYAPLCCPSFTRVPFGDHQSEVRLSSSLKLNAEQQRLPRLVLRRINNDETILPFLLNGAFGTGKSSVIAETVSNIVNCDGNIGCRVLICTRSYSAGKVYLDMFDRQLSDAMLNKVKMIVPQEKKPIPRFSIYNSSLSSYVFNANSVFITSLDNIANAMSSVTVDVPGVKLTFDYIFVDEAAQVLEVDVIIVYQFGDKKTKFVFAGDVFQMRPEYHNMSLKKFPVPIVCRLHQIYKRCPDYEICLKEVYRSNPILVRYLSAAIYDKYDLRSAMTSSSIKYPMKFIDANSDGINRETFDEDFYSYFNEREAEMIVFGIETFLKEPEAMEFSQQNILVCSPFYSQVKLIRDKLKKKQHLVCVELPSAIQGKEFDAVFISTVLTINNEMKYPIMIPTFHNNRNLINLAISRSKHYVEVVGDKKCLLEHVCKKQWNIFIEYSSR